jgi:hypothetical protein
LTVLWNAALLFSAVIIKLTRKREGGIGEEGVRGGDWRGRDWKGRVRKDLDFRNIYTDFTVPPVRAVVLLN